MTRCERILFSIFVLPLLLLNGCDGTPEDERLDPLANALKAMEFLDTNAIDRAISNQADIIALGGNEGMALHRELVRAWAQPNDRVGELLEEASIGPRYGNILLREKARGFIRANVPEKPVDTLDSIKHLYDSSPMFMLEYAEANGANLDLDAVIEALEHAASLSKRPFYAFMIMENIFSVRNRYDKTLYTVRKALSLNAKVPYLYYREGRACLNLGDYDGAISAFLKIKDVHPKSMQQLGNIYFSLGKHREAITYYEKLLERFPLHHLAAPQLTQCYAAIGDYEKAQNLLRQLIRRDPDNELAYILLGETLFLAGRPEQALKHLDEALEINPRLTRAHLVKSKCYINLGRIEEAEAELRLAR